VNTSDLIEHFDHVLNELGPSNAAFDGPEVVQYGVGGLMRVVAAILNKNIIR
jgi:hypothetical protein